MGQVHTYRLSYRYVIGKRDRYDDYDAFAEQLNETARVYYIKSIDDKITSLFL